MGNDLRSREDNLQSFEVESLLDLSQAPEPNNTTELRLDQVPKDGTKKTIDLDSDEFPEGGRQGWAAVCGAFCMLCITQGAVSAFGVYQDFYTREFLNTNTPSKIAWIGSTQLFLIFFLGLPTGKLFDDGYFRQLMLVGSTFYVVSHFLLSFAKPNHFYQVFLAQGLGVGIGMGLLFVPSLSLLFHYFKHRRVLAAGIASVGSAVGAICQVIGLNHLFNGPVGFPWGVRIFGFIFLFLVILGNVLMRTRLPPKKLRSDNSKPNIKKVVSDIPLLLAALGASLIVFGLYFPYFYTQLFAILHGIPVNLAFYSITILNGCNIFGRVILGHLADRWGPLNGISCFTMIKATTEQGLIPFTIIYGFLSGGYFALSAPAVSAFVQNTSELGFALGYTTFLQSFFVLVAQPIAGQVVDAPRYRWNRAIIFVGIIAFCGCLMVFVSRVLLVRRRKTWRV